MKTLKVILAIVLILIVIIAVVVFFFLGDVIKTGVETVGPEVTGVDITLADAKISPVKGHVSLQELVIGNPEGFKSDYLFRLGGLEVDMDVKSVTSDTIIIKKIHVTGPVLNYEKSLTTSNIGALLKHLEGDPNPEAEEEDDADKAEPEEEEEEETEAKEGGKKVVIEDFVIDGIRVKLSATLTGGKAITIPILPIHLTDIGKETEGASLTEVLSEIFGAIFGAVTKAATGSVKLVGEGAMFVGETALDGAELAGKGALKAGEATLDGAKVVGGAAVDGVEAVGGAAVGGAKAVGGAVGGGTKKLLGGMKNLVTSDETEEVTEEATQDVAEE